MGWVRSRYPNEKIVIRRICRFSLSYTGYRILYILSRGSHWRAETGSDLGSAVRPSVRSAYLINADLACAKLHIAIFSGKAEKLRKVTHANYREITNCQRFLCAISKNCSPSFVYISAKRAVINGIF